MLQEKGERFCEKDKVNVLIGHFDIPWKFSR